MVEQIFDLRSLANRLEKVEKENRMMKFMGILLLVMGILLGSLGIAISSNSSVYPEFFRAKTVVAEKITIVDKESNIVAMLGIKDKATWTYGGKQLIDTGGITLLLSDKSNNSQISIGHSSGVASIILADNNSKTGNADTAVLFTVSGGQPLLSFIKNGQTIWQAPPR
jgi:hypothetical protein